jgi:hypothetical protein
MMQEISAMISTLTHKVFPERPRKSHELQKKLTGRAHGGYWEVVTVEQSRRIERISGAFFSEN